MNHTLSNGIELLMHLAASPEPHGVSELSDALGLPKSHVHRLLQTLVAKRYVEQDRSRRYRIGVGALRLGHALLRDNPIRTVSLPVLQRLARETSWSASLTVRFGDEAISVAYATPDGSVRAAADTLGAVLGPVTSASGKLFLALREPRDRAETLPSLDYARRGPNSHPDAASLGEDLRRIAGRGFSVNDRENNERSFSVAVAVRGPDGAVAAALGLSDQPDRPPPPSLLDALVSSLRVAADEISRALVPQHGPAAPTAPTASPRTTIPHEVSP